MSQRPSHFVMYPNRYPRGGRAGMAFNGGRRSSYLGRETRLFNGIRRPRAGWYALRWEEDDLFVEVLGGAMQGEGVVNFPTDHPGREK